MSNQADRVRKAFERIEHERPLGDVQAGLIRIGLLGRGIGASLTPVMHEQEGRRHGLHYRYDLIDFDRLGLDDADLGTVLEIVGESGFRGVNVTFPFKQAIVPHLDDLSPSAAAIGAVNTVVFDGGRRQGHNTDCFGFAQSVRAGLGTASFEHVVQVGAGGAGAAVAQALAELGAKRIDIVDVDRQRAEALAEQIASANSIDVRGATIDQLQHLIPLASGIVNATPVGMAKVPGLPFDTLLLQDLHWVADIIYFPRETELIRRARDIGCKVLPGGGMAVFQAVGAFELFAGVSPDSNAMSKTFAAYA